MVKKCICKMCGREFVPEKKGDKFCPGVCSLTAGLIKTPKSQKSQTSHSSKASIESLIDRFPRVMAMFNAPLSDRWKMAKDFTPEEEEFSRRMQKRMLAEENRIDYDAAYGFYGNIDDDEKEQRDVYPDDRLGDSDDGSI